MPQFEYYPNGNPAQASDRVLVDRAGSTLGVTLGSVADLSDAAVDAVAAALVAHVEDTDAHKAYAISVTPEGGIAAGNVQDALAELDSEKATTGSVSAVAADLADLVGDLAPVATSGEYGDLTDKPTLGTAAAEDVGAFDPAGSAGSVYGILVAHAGATTDVHGIPDTSVLASIVNTDGDPGTTIYVGSIDPDVAHTPAVGDVWIQTP